MRRQDERLHLYGFRRRQTEVHRFLLASIGRGLPDPDFCMRLQIQNYEFPTGRRRVGLTLTDVWYLRLG